MPNFYWPFLRLGRQEIKWNSVCLSARSRNAQNVASLLLLLFSFGLSVYKNSSTSMRLPYIFLMATEFILWSLPRCSDAMAEIHDRRSQTRGLYQCVVHRIVDEWYILLYIFLDYYLHMWQRREAIVCRHTEPLRALSNRIQFNFSLV